MKTIKENLEQKVKQRLEKEYGYDFDSDFWTDEQHTMMNEIIECTESEIKKMQVGDVSGAFCGLPKDDTCDIEFSNKCWCCKFYVNSKQNEH